MANKISHIFVILAFSVVLVHSFVPHSHDYLTSCTIVHTTPQEPSNTLLSFLRTIFSADLGSNHLQDFRDQDQSPDVLLFTAVFVFSLFQFTLLQQEDTATFVCISPVLLPVEDCILKAKPLRAPPQA